MSQNHQQTVPPCAARLTRDDLSAWRDETLPADEADRIAAHSVDCPACQERLRGFETVATALRAQRIPGPDERLWRDVRAAILVSKPSTGNSDITHETTIPDQSGVAPIPHPTAGAHSRRRRALGTLAAVAAIALVVVGFGRLFQFGASNRPEPFQLHWRQVTLPSDLNTKNNAGRVLSVFPEDGSIAWLCQPDNTNPSPTDLRIWRTTDGGVSWKRLGTPQVAQVASCRMNLDQLDPDFAILDLSLSTQPNSPTTPASFVTFDGGAHWQLAPSTLPDGEMATLDGKTYLLTAYFSMLEVSTDGLKTWKRLDGPLTSQKLRADAFRINPRTGELLVRATFSQGGSDFSLWTADADGNNWRRLATPPSITASLAAASPTSDGQHWNICALAFGTSSDPEHPDFTSHVYCGTDQSASWRKLPGLDFSRYGATYCPSCADPREDPYGSINLIGIANDGTLLAIAEDRFDKNAAATRTSIYRLPAGSSHWQFSGATPKSNAFYMPRPGGGILWSMSSLSGKGDIFTASYPGAPTQPLPTQAKQTSTPTGNIDQGAPLAWQPINQPSGFQPKFTSSDTLAVAPSDGQTAYACAQPNNNGTPAQLRGWVTHDAGATWTTLAPPRVSGWCALVVDEVNPRDVLLGFSQSPPAGGPITPELYYRSADEGASWRHIPGLDGAVIYQFATYHGAVYALRDATPGSVGDFAHVQVSTDGMASWRTIDSGFFSSQTSAAQFWLNPYNGALLATNAPAPVNGIPVTNAASALIWRSSDGGAHWRSLQAPQTSGNTNILVQPPQPNHVWSICAASVLVRPATAPSFELICGDDSGQVARPMPLLDTGDPTALPHYTTYTSDGAILAVMTTTTGSGAIAYTVYRLPAGASRWQALGQTPEFSLIYAPTSGGDGMLWSVPVNGVATDAQGRVFRVAAP